ncbi:P-loop containing nucleoside triphosphate hydrolase protein [Mycena vulgaris]|nr:P-loop containing nucleoside triphosphate hydrolase protein [Mycena vulgaris]
MEKSNAKGESPNLDDYSYTTLHLGVWRLLLHRESFTAGFSLSGGLSVWSGKWQELTAFVPMVWQFLRDIWTLDPALVFLYLILRLGTNAEGILTLHTSSQLLRTVETGLTTGHPDIKAILRAVTIRVLCTVFTSTLSWASGRVRPILETRVTLHYEEYILRETLRLDLPTSADKNTEPTVSAAQVWSAFDYLTEFFQTGFQLSTQLIFTFQQDNAGIVFTLLSLVTPVLMTKFGRGLWMRAYVVYSDNVDYLRLRALKLLASKDYREDVISGDLGGWIYAEYKKARDRLGHFSDDDPLMQYGEDFTPITGILMRLGGDLPTLYWAASSILNPRGFTVTSLAILQQHAQRLQFTFRILSYRYSSTAQSLSRIKQMYSLADVRNQIVDGDETYPHSRLSTSKGMHFELRNVSFAYPGGKSKNNAIKNISLKIPAGSLVVIVGANGSGKSTVIKLLTRLYDVDSGEILADGVPIKNYRISDLRRVQALLTQDHKLYPLTLAENIGLGNPDRADDMGMVMQSAEAGGASEVIKKLNDGANTVLSPVNTARGSHLNKDKHKKLQSILEGLERKADVSGGEKQRLVASRTFMRFLSGNIRFAVADEPSSALDPKGEHQLFQRLRDAREGKTLIFVTHRFGHLVKHADLIICMKDGEAVELGTHKQLMERHGEYSELYNVQAQAFADS